MKRIRAFIDDKIKAKYSFKLKGIFIKYEASQISDEPAQICPVIKYVYNDKVYIERSSWWSDSRNWMYLKEGDTVDIFINPKNPKKFYAVIPELSPEDQKKAKEDLSKQQKDLTLMFIILFIIGLLITFLFF